MKKIGKYLILTLGALIVGSLLTWGGYAAVRSITGLAVAQSSTKWNSLKDAAQGDNLTTGVGAFGLYAFDGTNFDRLTATAGVLDVAITGGALAVVGGGTEATALRVTIANDSTGLVSIDDNGGLITVDGAITPADDFSNPTTAVSAFSHLAGWDEAESNWDRVLVQRDNGDNTSTSSSGHLATLSHPVEFDGEFWDRIRHSFTQSTTGITTNAAGTTLAMSTTPMSKHTMVIDRTAGSTDVVEIDLECSLDGTIFVQIGTITDLSNEPVLTSVDGTPCMDVRYNVVLVGAGNTLTIQLLDVR